jgi:hypothetical protein
MVAKPLLNQPNQLKTPYMEDQMIKTLIKLMAKLQREMKEAFH